MIARMDNKSYVVYDILIRRSLGGWSIYILHPDEEGCQYYRHHRCEYDFETFHHFAIYLEGLLSRRKYFGNYQENI